MKSTNKKSENSSAQERKLLRTIIDNVPVCIYAKDLKFRKTLVNAHELKQFGFNDESEVLGKTDTELYGESVGADTQVEDSKVMIDGKSILDEEKHLGNGIWALISKLPLRDESDKIVGMVGISVNFTEHKKYREQLEVFNHIFNDLSDAIQVSYEDGRLFYLNKIASQRLGIEPDEIWKFHVWDFETVFAHQEDWQQHVDFLKKNKMVTIEGVNINQVTGDTIPVEVTVKYLVINETGFVVATSRDISERRKHELELQSSYERLNELSKQSKTFAWEIDTNGTFTFMSPIVEIVLGYTPAEMIGKMHFYDILSIDNRTKVTKEAFGIIADRKEAFNYEKVALCKDNTPIWLLTNCAPMYNEKGVYIGYRGSDTDISEQKKLQSKLEKARFDAEKSAKAKELFLTNMSHEIRTPLNVIIGMIREIGKENLLKSQQTYLKHAESSAYHLLSIINNVLDMSKIEAGEFVLDHKDFNMSAMLSNIGSILKSRASSKKINFDVVSNDNIARALRGDSLRLSQVLINLLGNAIKFTDQGFVNLTVRLVEENAEYQKIRFEVSDSGIGMSEEFLNNIFNKFTQENDHSNRSHEGTGLGMSISKEIVELMGGSIEIASEKGRGTSMAFELIFMLGSEDNLIRIDRTTRNFDISGTKVLVVEDNEMNRFIAHQSLMQAKCVIDEAGNGLEAIEKLKTNHYDIVLMDIQMPEMDGVEATKIIRNDMNIQVPIIALTANAFKHDIDLYLSIGMDDFLIKPYKEEELFSKIESNCRLEKHQTQLAKNDDVQSIHSDSVQSNETGVLYKLDQLQIIANGDQKFVDTMLDMFEKIASDTIFKMSNALVSSDIDSIKQLAHKIKPSLDNMGITILYDDIRTLENFNLKTNCPDTLRQKVQFVNATLSGILIDLQKRKQTNL
ncbi:MAG: hypothetical protein AUK44_09530 [Porphyromonadaceae bacterium CG2_30_38_12]|nr:MAG: hypothetical protein AUK44_09530 [Porphyromonadaceae bacterium CG2_30_38_12]